MAQTITAWFICGGRYRVEAIGAVGRRDARIIEIKDVDSGERFHGSARRLQRFFETLGSCEAERIKPATANRHRAR
jgi:hypothetical protein